MTMLVPVFRDDHCANCQEPLPEEVDGLFCSELCQQTATLIRWWRRKIMRDELDRPDVIEALQMRVAHILGGGYHGRARTIPADTRRFVIERDSGRCVKCGAVGTEIDHIAGDSNDPSNLQLLCHPCHHAKTAERFVPASESDQQLVAHLEARAVAPIPLLLCDDEETWDGRWRALKRERRERLLLRLTHAGIDTAAFGKRTPRSELIVALDDALTDGPEPSHPDDFDGGYGPGSYYARAMERDD